MKANRTTVSMHTAPEPAPSARDDLTPRIFVAPELRGRELEHSVIRDDDDSDEDYASCCELVALILEAPEVSVVGGGLYPQISQIDADA
jgi:hypothetical protein